VFFIQSRVGLKSITVIEEKNATLSPSPGSFTPGTTEPFTITATKIDKAKPSRVELRVCDPTQCIQCDPVIALVIREAGKPVSQTITELPEAENKVTIYNGSPGLRTLTVEVNGIKFQMAGLKDGEERAINISEALLPGRENVIILTGRGKPGGSADVMIHE
jgi:hypothetical protein